MRIASDALTVEVDPERGGEIAQVHAFGIPLLFGWQSRGGGSGDSASRWLERYRGGWQTIFPNGGEESDGFGFHGSACLARYEHQASEREIFMRAVVDDFAIERTVRIIDDALDVFESITSSQPRDVMWSHHPAFGAPLVSAGCIVETNAREFLADPARDAPLGDLQPGSRTQWPFGAARDGSKVDLRRLPDPGDRFGYLIECSRASITNAALGLSVGLDWEGFDHAWYWLEAHASDGFPWCRDAYVFGLEPASSYPGHGLSSVRASNGPLVHFEAGETKRVRVSLRAQRIEPR